MQCQGALAMDSCCSFCGAGSARKQCGSCRTAVYCSIDCQRSDWKGHKLTCVKPGRANGSGVTAQANFPGFDISSTILEDTLLGKSVLQHLDPLSSYAAICAVSSNLHAICVAEDVWHALLDNWPQRDPFILSVTYTGQRFSGRRRLAHVRGAVSANQAFYNYFASGRCSSSQVDALMHEESTVIHPGGICQQGKVAIESWCQILGGPQLPLRCIRQRWRVDDSLAVVVCSEDFRTNMVEATNVFECTHGKWRMVHHQGGHCREVFR